MKNRTLPDQSQDSFKIDPSFDISEIEENESPEITVDWSHISIELKKVCVFVFI